MEENKFAPGTRVASKVIKYNHYEDGPDFRVGTVLENPVNNEKVVLVQWDIPDWESKLYPNKKKTSVTVNVLDLMLEEEANEKYSELEANFKKVELQISTKITEAATLLKEANKLSEQLSEVEGLHELHDAMSPLIKVMDNMGWNTSSLHC